MRFRPQFVCHLVTRCSMAAFASAFAVSTLLSGSAEAVQGGYSYSTTQYGAYGSAATGAPSPDYSTSRPFVSDQTGSNSRSMSPDNWGNSAPSATDPSATAPGYRPTAQPGQASYAYGRPPAPNPTVQTTSPAFVTGPAPSYQYESTGAPSVQSLVGRQNERQTPPLNRAAPPETFAPSFNAPTSSSPAPVSYTHLTLPTKA